MDQTRDSIQAQLQMAISEQTKLRFSQFIHSLQRDVKAGNKEELIGHVVKMMAQSTDLILSNDFSIYPFYRQQMEQEQDRTNNYLQQEARKNSRINQIKFKKSNRNQITAVQNSPIHRIYASIKKDRINQHFRSSVHNKTIYTKKSIEKKKEMVGLIRAGQNINVTGPIQLTKVYKNKSLSQNKK